MSLPTDLWTALLNAFARTAIPAITTTELLLVVSIAIALSIPRRSWKYVGLLATATHELGHAFAAVTSGQRLSGIRLRFDHSGATTTYSRSRLATAWSCFWGYPVPAVVGAAFVWCGFNGWGPAALAASTVALAATLVFLRNAAGFLITTGAILGCIALILLVPAGFLGHTAVILGLVLLVGAVRDLIKLTHVHLRRRDRLATSDAYLLYRTTAVPSGIWILLFSVLVAGSWLVAWQPVSAILP
ncbi:peptidase M50B-like protein [Arthrobacter sp. SLBN-100]|uniref:M50 family metallopeptidase n=1 Tax=Arthrobacter sp. SLBN-100 TaxID=2768450 RepID=UPI00114E61DE|nr:M50 family metallopeptidase [Arthrobacter sp. SLBN-100]TQJ66537.1 peptidase M50B-like protein [Arthrobacter sp. SLBN-100]